MTSDSGSEEFEPGLGNIPPAAHDDYGPVRRRRWPWLVGLGVLGLAGLVAAGPSLLSTSWLNGQVRTYLRDNLQEGTAIDFGQLDISWTEGIRLTDLEIRRGTRDAHPLLTVPTVEFDADVWPLLVRRLDVRKFVFHDPVVRIERTREGALNTEDVVRTGRKKKKGEDGEEVEQLVLPPIDVPVEVHGLKLVIVADDGREVERTGIEFQGYLTTRKGPTTFDLHVPVGNGKMDVKGTMTLFEADGTLLPFEQMAVKTDVRLDTLDAAENRDLLTLFLADAPTGGVLDGHVTVDSVGKTAQGDLEMTLRGLSVDGAQRAAGDAPDLRLTGAFQTDGERFEIRDGLVEAEGLVAHAAFAGTAAALDGTADVQADLATSAAALRAMGIHVPDGVAGRLTGTLTFRPSPSRGEGSFELLGLRAPAAVEGGAPLAVDRLTGQMVVLPGADAVQIESIRLEVPNELSATLNGHVGHDGTLALASQVRALVPAMMERAKAMALAPQDLAIAGTLEGKFQLERGEGEDTALLTIDSLSLRDEGVLVQAQGTARSDGSVHLTVDGEGALERLLAAGGAGAGLAAVTGTFSFAATADGPADGLAAELKHLRLDGDLAVAASGKMRPDGRIDGNATLDGRIPKAVALARGLGLVEGEVPLDGRIHGEVQLAGTHTHPEVPSATLRIDEGPLDVSVTGSISDSGAVKATVDAVAQLDALASVAHAQGALARACSPGGSVRLMAVVAGTRDAPEVPKASVTVSGPLSLRADGSMGSDRAAHVRADFSGALERLVPLLSAVRDEDVSTVTGTYEGAFSLDGTPEAAQMRLSRLLVRSEGLTVDASASLRPGGTGELAAEVRGPVEGAFALAHGFGMLADVSGTGKVDVALDARLVGEKDERAATGSFSATLLDLALLRTDAQGVVWGEERVVLSVPAFRVPLGERALAEPPRPIDATFETGSGVKLQASVLGGTGGRPVELDATLRGPVQPLVDASAAFTGGGAGLKIGGSIRTTEHMIFKGDVTAGLANATGWTGGTLLELTDVVAPYVAISKGTVRAKLADGLVLLDPIDLAVNGGTAQGTATIGLVGEKPEHAIKLTAQNVRIDADLAPLLARAAPILAVGDVGDAGGETGIELDLTAKGLDADKVKKTVSGHGVLHLKSVYAQSRNWLGTLLDLAGAGSRLEVLSADVPFTVTRGQVTTENLDLAATGMDLRLGGQIGLDGSIDYAFGLKPKKDSSTFGKYAKLLDKDGFLPLRLKGDLTSPDLKLPSIGDAVKGGLGGLLDDVLNRDKKKEEEERLKKEQEEAERQRRREERKKRKAEEQGGTEDPTPPDEPK